MVGSLGACRQEAPLPTPQYSASASGGDTRPQRVFLVHPLQNPQLLHQKFEPLMRYLEAQAPGQRFVLETSNDYADFERKLRQGTPDFALPNPYHATLARDWGYRVIAKMGNDELFRGVFIVRKDSPIRTPADLKGKTIAYPAPTALAAAMMPQLYLQKNGIDVQRDLKNMYVGTHQSAIMNAYLRQSDISATWPVAWEAFGRANPVEAAELKLLWQTPKLIQNAIVARRDLPDALVSSVSQVLTHLQDSAEGKAVLAGIDTTRFEPAADPDFDVVRQFLDEFNRLVRGQP
ncbi:MAG: hypothetical protein OHK0048_26560 [Rhodoferax sp.]